MAADHGAHKRPREETPEIDSPEEENKKLRYEYDELLLDDLVEGSDPDPTIPDLDSVIKSLEDEIEAGSGLVSQPEFGYLLEASDDELGLPPSTASDKVVGEGVGEFFWLGENWGFEDEEAEFRFVDGGDGGGEYLALDGLFDYTDARFGSTEFPWRSESMSAQ